MSEWKKLKLEDVYVIVANDISDSFQRYFAPIVALINGVQKSVNMPAGWQKKKLEQDKSNVTLTPDIPIVVEDEAFISMWRPSLRDRLNVALGAPVRVLVNYSVHGPLHVDTERGWGTSSLGAG
jgi:hypothetical protein